MSIKENAIPDHQDTPAHQAARCSGEEGAVMKAPSPPAFFKIAMYRTNFSTMTLFRKIILL
jgi:hypothetical protein